MQNLIATASVDDPAIGRAITVLLEMYKENTNHGRHLETQRQLVTGFVLTIAAAALGALATLHFKKDACVGLGFVLVVFGLIGTLFSIVQYGKYTQSRQRWRAARERLARLSPLADLSGIAAASRPGAKPEGQCSPAAWLKIGNTPLHWLWTLLMFVVFTLGGLLVNYAASLSSWAASGR
jgi:hypothetical protein